MSSKQLPNDYPHREALIAGGLVTRAQVRAASDSRINRLPTVGPAGVKAIRAYETANPESLAEPAAADAQRQDETEAARRKAEEERQRAEEEARRRAEEEVARQAEAQRFAEAEAARKAEEEAAAARRREEEERALPAPQLRMVRVKVENLGHLKRGAVTSEEEVVALLDKPYGHRLVEEVE